MAGGGKHAATTLRIRFRVSIAMLAKAARLPVSRFHKAKIIRAKTFPAALYGSEVAQPTEKDIGSLTTAILRTIANKTSHHDVDWLFASCFRGSDLDVVPNLVARKCTPIRRCIGNKQHQAQRFQDMVRKHAQIGTQGATTDSDEQSQQNGSLVACSPAPHPTRGTRSDWKPLLPPTDPVGHLLADLVYMGAKLNDKLQVLVAYETAIDLLETPYQYLHGAIM